jgi:hypothetical protein
MALALLRILPLPTPMALLLLLIDGECGDIFHRNDRVVEIWNHYYWGPVFGGVEIADLCISSNCYQNMDSESMLGGSYGESYGEFSGALFGQWNFRVVHYEVFKIVIE